MKLDIYWINIGYIHQIIMVKHRKQDYLSIYTKEHDTHGIQSPYTDTVHTFIRQTLSRPYINRMHRKMANNQLYHLLSQAHYSR